MTITSLKWIQKATATREVLASNAVRTLIANHLGVDVKSVTDEAHFTDDLGADWLDRLEFEDQFADVLVTDEEVDQLEVVGDLIRHIENVEHERRRRSIVDTTPLHRRGDDAPVIRIYSHV
jgi:acyl carrier protein